MAQVQAASSGSTGAAPSGGTSSGGAGSSMGSGYSWIADIFKVVGGVTNNAFAMDQRNRAYKYNLYAPLPFDNNKTQINILLVAMAVVVVFMMIFLLLKKDN